METRVWYLCQGSDINVAAYVQTLINIMPWLETFTVLLTKET